MIFWILVLLLVLGALRLRGRVGHYALLPDTERDVHESHVFLTAQGVELSAATRRAASAYARAAGLDLLHLVPGNWSVNEWMGFAELCDPLEYRTRPLHVGCSAGHAMLVERSVLERGGEALEELGQGLPVGMAAFVGAAMELRRCAPHSSGIAVAPDLIARSARGEDRAAALRTILGDLAQAVILVQGAVFAFLIASLFVDPSFGWPLVALYHLQVPLALGGQGRTSRRLWPFILARLPLDVLVWADTVLHLRMWNAGGVNEELRAEYTSLLAEDWRTRFEARRSDCPSCGSQELVLTLEHADFFQHKPGRFRLETCQSCGLVFQNPRLTPEGLEFYYKDFYDGLGAEKLDFIFSFEPDGYEHRARMVEGHLQERLAPRRWLDVGGGHGHFCLSAAGHWPQTRFEVLDLADSVVAAERRGWVEAGHRALFPDWAQGPAAADADQCFDVVSMSHYLEHTLDPRAEIAAAHSILEPGGLLLIELPDPECPFGRWLGWTWLPWFQPQHLNMLPLRRLEHELATAGFEVLERERGAAHQRVDLHYALLVLMGRLAPEPDRPWLPPTHFMGRLRHAAVWLVGLPLLLPAKLIDQFVIGPFAGRLGLSNTYRVLGRAR